MLKIILSNQRIIDINESDVLSFYNVVGFDGDFVLKNEYTNSLDNQQKERISFGNGTTSVSGEISELMVHNKHGYEGLAIAFSRYEFFSVNHETKIISCKNVVEIIKE